MKKFVFDHCNNPPADMLINDIAKLFDDNIRKKSVNFPTYEQFGGRKGFSARHILFYLGDADRDKESINQLSLAKLTHLTAPTVSVALQKMEAQGLIEREHNSNDMRETMVKITDKGREFNDFLKNSIMETSTQMFDGISDDEMEQLKTTLIKIRNNLMD